jgi:hypothetical protein
MALPIATTAEDVRRIVVYLKNKPTGATPIKARAALKKQVNAFRFPQIFKDFTVASLREASWL